MAIGQEVHGTHGLQLLSAPTAAVKPIVYMQHMFTATVNRYIHLLQRRQQQQQQQQHAAAVNSNDLEQQPCNYIALGTSHDDVVHYLSRLITRTDGRGRRARASNALRRFKLDLPIYSICSSGN
jgi:hypothetical protein